MCMWPGQLDSRQLDPMKVVETLALEIAHQIKFFGANLPTALYFRVTGVFSTPSVQKPFILVKVLGENVKYFSSSIKITFWSQKCLRKRSWQQRGILSSWVGVYLEIFTRLLWMTSFFFQNSKNCRVFDVVFPGQKPLQRSYAVFDALQHSVNHFHSF
jgi:hypothetical protein